MSGDFGLWGGTAGPPISDQVWPPSGTPFLSLACLRPQPTAEPEQPAAPRTSVARPLTRHPGQMECSPTIFLMPQPHHCHGLPSAFPSRLQARSHPPPTAPPPTTTTNALELGPPLPRPALAWPALPCPEVHQCGPPSGSADPSRPHAHPYLPQIRPSLSHAPGRASPPRPCSCRGPAPAACSLPAFGQVPASPTHPFMLALQEDSTQAPLGLPASPSARRRPLSLR